MPKPTFTDLPDDQHALLDALVEGELSAAKPFDPEALLARLHAENKDEPASD